MTTPNAPTGEQVLDLGGGGAFVSRTTDPLILPQPYASPTDFSAQYPTPLDTTELVAMCEEITLWQAIPELTTGLQQETWRELNELAFTSGSAYISFADGECPEEYAHDGDNTTVTLKNIGAKKSLSISDIKHSAAVAAAGWNGINRLVGGPPSSEGMPGGANGGTFMQEVVADVKEKEIRLASTLVMNGWDRLLAEGDATTNTLEFDGIENLVDSDCGAYINTGSPSGTFSAITYDRFLADSCAKPTTIMGHSSAIQEMMAGYFQLGYQGSQLVNFNDGNRITPGYNFASFVNTGVDRLAVVADYNFNRAAAGGATFLGTLFGMRMTHNGVPLVYKRTQIPFSVRDLVPGCTAVSFEVWAKTALIVKHCCAHSRFTAIFNGNINTTCPQIG